MTELLLDILLDSLLLELCDSWSPEPGAAPEVLRLVVLVSGTVRVSPMLLLIAL